MLQAGAPMQIQAALSEINKESQIAFQSKWYLITLKT
jgi:hypothetical protein